MKYALGLDPFTDSVESLPDVQVVGGVITLTYNKVLAATDKDRAARFLNDLFIIEANWEASQAEALEVLKRPVMGWTMSPLPR